MSATPSHFFHNAVRGNEGPFDPFIYRLSSYLSTDVVQLVPLVVLLGGQLSVWMLQAGVGHTSSATVLVLMEIIMGWLTGLVTASCE